MAKNFQKEEEIRFLREYENSLKKNKLKSEIVGVIASGIVWYSTAQINGDMFSIAGEDIVYQGVRIIGLLCTLFALTRYIDAVNQTNIIKKDRSRLE